MSEVPVLPIELRNQLKERFDWTDEQIDKHVLTSPKMLKLLEAIPRIRDYKMIAEVVKSEGCVLKLKPGDKYVFLANGILLPEESASLCLWALAPMMPCSFVIFDRIYAGLDPEQFFPDHIKCADVGVECGGFGEVLFKLYCEKI